MLPPLPRLSDYDVSPHNGFLPDEIPLDVLPNVYYQPWEAIVRNFQSLILAKRLRRIVDALPVLETDLLLTEAEWRRAYSILGFITHGYIWGGERPADVVPPSISIPFLKACQHLELPPVATYAGVCLWNWRALFRGEPMDSLDNLATHMTFTGSLDESWFYLVSVAIEARAGPIVPMMLEAIAAVRGNDTNTVVKALRSFAERLDELGTLLERMYESCDPHVFYHRIRPFLAGSKNMADAGLPQGVMFDDGTGQQPYVQFSGGSNAQSSIIQFFDVVLGVEHRPTGEKRADTSSPPDTGAIQSPPHGFIQDMRRYMPGAHRRFLERMEQVANIRDFVNLHRSNRALTNSYDACLAMLRSLRDKHIQLVSRYIIIKSRESRSNSRSLSPQQAKSQRVNLANTLARNGSKKLRGTGGTALIPFLKQARDETGEPAIDTWARRLLNNGPGDIGVAAFGGRGWRESVRLWGWRERGVWMIVRAGYVIGERCASADGIASLCLTRTGIFDTRRLLDCKYRHVRLSSYSLRWKCIMLSLAVSNIASSSIIRQVFYTRQRPFRPDRECKYSSSTWRLDGMQLNHEGEWGEKAGS